jgi:ATP-dependent RNA helicase RhlE
MSHPADQKHLKAPEAYRSIGSLKFSPDDFLRRAHKIALRKFSSSHHASPSIQVLCLSFFIQDRYAWTMKRIVMNSKTFEQLGLIEPLLRAVRDEGYTDPTPIQEAAIPELIAGRDLLGGAQTGTGKTAAFALPIIQRLTGQRIKASPRSVRALILTPTRELAAQIGDSFKAYSRHLRLSRTVIFGGVGQMPQVRALSRGVDVLVATPGRLLDLMGQKHLRLDSLEVFVLDEADRMLDMGFINDVRKVIAELPQRRQSLFFSATMPTEIVRLADSMLNKPVKVEVDPQASTVDLIDQSVMYVTRGDKRSLLAHVLSDTSVTRALVFTRTKHGADKVVRQLDHAQVKAEAIHGNKSQTNRTRAMDNFRRGQTRVLVATDIAARGIDVEGISHVVNYDLPNIPESYVHRIGRTARAGKGGIAVSFCDTEERAYLKDIEKLIGQKVPVEEGHPWHAQGAAAAKSGEATPKGERTGGGNGNGSRRNPSSPGKGSRRNPSSSGHRGGHSNRFSGKSESEGSAQQRHR